jgi:hypothetical protein
MVIKVSPGSRSYSTFMSSAWACTCRGGGCLVQQENLGPVNEHAGKGQPLLLAFRQVARPGQVFVIELRQEPAEPRGHERVDDPAFADTFGSQRIGHSAA